MIQVMKTVVPLVKTVILLTTLVYCTDYSYWAPYRRLRLPLLECFQIPALLDHKQN